MLAGGLLDDEKEAAFTIRQIQNTSKMLPGLETSDCGQREVRLTELQACKTHSENSTTAVDFGTVQLRVRILTVPPAAESHVA